MAHGDCGGEGPGRARRLRTFPARSGGDGEIAGHGPAAYHRRIGSRWSKHDFRLQAVLTCAFLEGGHTYRQLAEGNGIPRSTCYDLIQEGIKVLARRALPLTEVVRLAVAAGWDYLIVDGVNIPTNRINSRIG